MGGPSKQQKAAEQKQLDELMAKMKTVEEKNLFKERVTKGVAGRGEGGRGGDEGVGIGGRV